MRALRKRLGLGAALLALACGACGGGDSGSPTGTGLGSPEDQIASLRAPGRSAEVELCGDIGALSDFGEWIYPEVRALLQLGAGSIDVLVATLSDPALDGHEDGDRVRALAASVLEQMGASAVLPALTAYLARANEEHDPHPFFSTQAAAHAVAALAGLPHLVQSRYSYQEVQAVLAAAPSFAAPNFVTAPIVTVKGRPIKHARLLGPTKPPARWTREFNAGEMQQRRDYWEQKLGIIGNFEDPIIILEEATRSYDCHSYTFRYEDTRLPDLFDRYHIHSEAVPVLLEDEYFENITATPSRWAVGDVVVFRKAPGAIPTHTGRLSQVGTSLDDPNLRFANKFSMTHPVLDISVRDCTKTPYGKIVEIWSSRGSIVFVSTRSGFSEIHTMSSTGENVQQLTNSGIKAVANPVWSPDRTKIAFQGGFDVGREIYVMNADGSGIVRLTDNTWWDDSPSWSPDGSQCVYQSFVPAGMSADSLLCVVSSTGGAPTCITRAQLGGEGGFDPDWSGSWIYFTGVHRDPATPSLINHDIYRVKPDGTGFDKYLRTDDLEEEAPRAHPDTGVLVFTASAWSGSSWGERQIYTLASGGGTPVRRTTTSVHELDPCWNPDGKKIAFTSHRDGNAEIYVMSADGSGLVNLTNHPGADYDPDW